MADDEESEGGGSMDSIESRWVFQDEDDDSEIDEDADDDGADEDHRRTVMDSEDDEDDDNAEQRLIRTGPRIDSFDVEALEVPGALRNEYEVVYISPLSSNLLVFCLLLLFCYYSQSLSDWLCLNLFEKLEIVIEFTH